MAASVEDFERWVVSTVQVLLPAALTQTMQRYLEQDQTDDLCDDNGATLVQLELPERYYPGGTNIVTRWPAIEVAVPEDDISEFAVGQTDAVVATTLVVQCWLKHARFEVLNPMVKRYTATVFDVLRDPATLPGHEIERCRRAWGTNPEARDENDDRIMAGGLLVLTLNGAWIRA